MASDQVMNMLKKIQDKKAKQKAELENLRPRKEAIIEEKVKEKEEEELEEIEEVEEVYDDDEEEELEEVELPEKVQEKLKEQITERKVKPKVETTPEEPVNVPEEQPKPEIQQEEVQNAELELLQNPAIYRREVLLRFDLIIEALNKIGKSFSDE